MSKKEKAESQANYIATKILAGGATVGGHLIPNENEIYDLGSKDARWHDLFLSGNTIYLGETTLSYATEGAVLLGGSRIAVNTGGNVSTILGGVVTLTNTTTSTSSSTGALIVRGGVGIDDNVVVKNGMTVGGPVGIGTRSPSVRLDLGTGGANQILGISNSLANGFYGFGASSANLFYQAGTNSGHVFYTGSLTGNLGTERMRITTGGNVGIGTTTVLSTIHMYSGIENTEIRLQNTGTNQIMRMGVENGGDRNMFIRGSGLYDLVMSTNDIERIRIKSGGLIGIGTTNPQGDFHLHRSNENAEIRISTNLNNSHNLDIGAEYGGEGRYFIYGYGNYSIALGTNGTERMRITETGNVGIGTSNAANKLEINGSVGINGGVRISRSGGINYIQFANSTSSSTSGSSELRFTNVLGELGSAYMTLTADPYVGIGITNPGVPLDFGFGSFYMVGANRGANGFYGIGADSSSLLYHSNSGHTWRTGSLVGDTGSVIMRLTSAGNLGMGTFTPVAKLHLIGDGTTGATFMSGSVGIGITNPAQTLHVSGRGYFGSPTYTTWSSGQSISVISSGARLVANSDVNGWPVTSGSTASSANAFRIRGADDAILDMGINSGSGAWLQSYNVANYSLNFPILLNPNGGNIGIGITNPSSLLTVNGNSNGEVAMRVVNTNAGSSAYTILRVDNNNSTADDAILFLNSSTRTADGGINTATLRNDAGDLRVQSRGAIHGLHIKGGNVGVQTTLPWYAFDTPGQIRTQVLKGHGTILYYEDVSNYPSIPSSGSTQGSIIDGLTAMVLRGSGPGNLTTTNAGNYIRTQGSGAREIVSKLLDLRNAEQISIYGVKGNSPGASAEWIANEPVNDLSLWFSTDKVTWTYAAPFIRQWDTYYETWRVASVTIPTQFRIQNIYFRIYNDNGLGGFFDSYGIQAIWIHTHSLTIDSPTTINGESRINGSLVLTGGLTTYTSGAAVDEGNRTYTYLTFAENNSGNDHAYLRQIGGSNGFMMSLDIHDDGDDAGFQIRDVQSAINPDNAPVTRFIVNRGGNVGVGMTNPQTKLHVLGADGNGNSVYISNGDVNKRLGFFQDAGNNASGVFSYNYGNSTPMSLLLNSPGGNVGIGMTPAYTLDVNGTIRGNGSAIAVQAGQNGGTGRGLYWWFNTDSNWTSYFAESGGGRSNSGGTATSGAGFNSWAIRNRVNNDSTVGFIWENSSEALLASIRGSDGLTYFAGNVGLGTTNPSAKLHIPYSGSFGSGTIRIGNFPATYGENLYTIQWGSEDGLGVHPSGRGVFGRQGMGFHMLGTHEFSIRSSGWDNLFGIEGGTGNCYIKGNLQIGWKYSNEKPSKFYVRCNPGDADNGGQPQGEGKGIRINHNYWTNYWDITHRNSGQNTDINNHSADLCFVHSYPELVPSIRCIMRAYGNNVTLNFTGQHRCFINEQTYDSINKLIGLIVVANKNDYIKMSGGTVRGKDAITISESLPIVSLSMKEKDKKCFGVVSMAEDPENRQDEFGNIITPYKKEKGDTRAFINSVGEGAIWVTNINGPLESGDYITSSKIPGYGMRQDDDLLHNYTVAKITMECDFTNPKRKKYKIKKQENNQMDKNNQDNEKNGGSDYEEDVRENVIDENGNLIWEEVVTEDGKVVMEDSYDIRYVVPDGTQITEYEYHNLILEGKEAYIAAFVGCTYHCG